MTGDPEMFAINCSIMFKELPLLERPAAAKAAGFDAVEFWWPFETPTPDDTEMTAFTRAIQDAGVALTGLNFYAGDMPAGDRGVLSQPHRAAHFRANVPFVVELGRELGCRAFNALYGNRIEDADPAAQDATALENLTFAARAVEEIDGTVLIEPVSGSPGYPLLTADDVMAVVDRLRARGVANVRMLCDLYHLAVNGDDLGAVIANHATSIGHVQIADAPGRHEPGTGGLQLREHVAQLRQHGYDGWIALEYNPSVATADSFTWMEDAGWARR